MPMKIDSNFWKKKNKKKNPRFKYFCFNVLYNVFFISIKQSEDSFLRP